MSERIILVDLNSGKYTRTQKGYELYNLEQNQDGKYYGFVPNADNVDIKKLDPKKSDRSHVVLWSQGVDL